MMVRVECQTWLSNVQRGRGCRSRWAKLDLGEMGVAMAMVVAMGMAMGMGMVLEVEMVGVGEGAHSKEG